MGSCTKLAGAHDKQRIRFSLLSVIIVACVICEHLTYIYNATQHWTECRTVMFVYFCPSHSMLRTFTHYIYVPKPRNLRKPSDRFIVAFNPNKVLDFTYLVHYIYDIFICNLREVWETSIMRPIRISFRYEKKTDNLIHFFSHYLDTKLQKSLLLIFVAIKTRKCRYNAQLLQRKKTNQKTNKRESFAI